MSRPDYPAGTIGQLFNRTYDLYEAQGRPPLKKIAARVVARRAGIPIGSTTIHRILVGSHVPRWETLASYVLALEPNADLGEFRDLRAAAANTESRCKELLQKMRASPETGALCVYALTALPPEAAAEFIAEMTGDLAVWTMSLLHKLDPEAGRTLDRVLRQDRCCAYAVKQFDAAIRRAQEESDEGEESDEEGGSESTE